MHQQNPEILTVKQAAKLLQLSEDIVYPLTHRRDFPAVRIGRTIRIPRDLLMSWVNAQANKGGYHEQRN